MDPQEAPEPFTAQQPEPEASVPPEPAAGDPRTRVPNILPVTEPGERTLCVIRRHRIGILGTYLLCGFATLVAAAFSFIAVPAIMGGNDKAFLYGGVLFLLVAAVCIAFAGIASKVYWGNTWTLTTDSLTQVRHFSLFNRQSSQLSLKDLEDVTAEQQGVLPEMFNYGMLRVETAGERSKFMFPFCPNPNYYAQQILAAREAFERNRTSDGAPGDEPRTPSP